jgi:hypothetical protein
MSGTDHGDRETRLDKSLETVDAAKRQTLRRLIVGAAFAVPVVTSFSIDGLTVNPAMAAPGNLTVS